MSTIRRYIEAVGGRLVVTTEEIDMELKKLMARLQDIGDAVRRNDRGGYLTAVDQARVLGASDEQLRNAYDYPASQMTSRPSFTHDGIAR